MSDFEDFIVALGIGILFITIIVGIVVGIPKGIDYLRSEELKEATAECEKIAKLAETKEYKVDGSYSCIVVKDNKLTVVEGW